MASLHDIDEGIRIVGKWFAIGGGIILLLIVLYILGRNVKEYFYPTPPPRPTVAFEKLPPLPFPTPASTPVFSYSLNTATGDLPVFSDREKVFTLAQNPTDLLALQKSKAQVANIGFISTPTAITATKYAWDDEILPSRHLELDIVTKNFTLTSAYKANPEVLVINNLPNEAEAKAIAQKYLQALKLFSNDIDTNKTVATLLQINPDGTTQKASSLSSAQVVRVDFFQKDVHSLPIYYPDPPETTMTVYVGGGQREAQVVQASFFHYQSTDTFATYPIKSAQDAYQELTKGKAYIASYFGSASTIEITNVSLGYYLGKEPQIYLMPIVVFEGTDGFLAYVSAVTDPWIIPANK